MLRRLKNFLYFPVARYFLFFASIRLRRWRPIIIVVTGSNGKTTLLHLLEAQIGRRAKYSHHANSSFGIPFDVLGLQRKSLLKIEWIELFLKAPVRAFFPGFKEKIYVVEADCDRPYEGKFLASFLRPEVVLWASIARTHGMNFERLVEEGRFATVEEAIAFEFGYFLEYCRGRVFINGDSDLVKKQIERTKAKVVEVRDNGLESYSVDKKGTVFVIGGKSYSFKALLPKEVFYSVSMCAELMRLDSRLRGNDRGETLVFTNFNLPPGRSSIFKGIRNTTIIDSSYNVDLSSMKAVLDMFAKMEGDHKWVVVGDILEQGSGEAEEHERLGEMLRGYKFERVILMGPRVYKYIDGVVKFVNPKEALDYLLDNLQGGEMVLFKGARFMEGIIEKLLLDKGDISKLARREKVWEERRRSFGL